MRAIRGLTIALGAVAVFDQTHKGGLRGTVDPSDANVRGANRSFPILLIPSGLYPCVQRPGTICAPARLTRN